MLKYQAIYPDLPGGAFTNADAGSSQALSFQILTLLHCPLAFGTRSPDNLTKTIFKTDR